MNSFGEDAIGKWFLYDIDQDMDFTELVYVNNYEHGHYTLTLYTSDGQTYKNIPITHRHFDTYALSISPEEAMIEKLKRI